MSDNYAPEETRVNGATGVYVADVGATFPTDIDTPIGGDWIHLGLTTEEGVKPGFKKTVGELRASQRFYAVRRFVTSIESTVAFVLMQWNSDTVRLGLGGGDIEEVSSGLFKYTPPAVSFIDERALLLETVDGDITYRWGFTRVENTRDFDTDFVRTNGAFLPIGLSLLDPGDDDAFFFLTDDPAMPATGS